MLDLWKPIKTIKSKPIIFTETGMYYDQKNYFNNYRPFVIFYDDKEDCYWYLKARDAFDDFGNPKFNTNTLNNSYKEVLIKSTHKKNSLFTKDSLVDCSQIFKIDASLLEKIIDYDDILYKQTQPLELENIEKILNKIADNIFEVPPYLSIVEVYSDRSYYIENNTFSTMYGDSIYLHPSKYEYLKNQYFNGDIEIPKNKTIKDFEFNDSKLKEAIRFCEMFLKEYFPDKLQEFRKAQGIESSLDKDKLSKLKQLESLQDQEEDEELEDKGPEFSM